MSDNVAQRHNIIITEYLPLQCQYVGKANPATQYPISPADIYPINLIFGETSMFSV